MEELLLIDKPEDITSFDVIRILRKRLGVSKMGHAGTLDPMATGLMLIGVGNGTKKLHEYLKLPKEYIAEVRIGERTTTGDREGRVLETKDVPQLEINTVKETLHGMVGTLTLPVSAYSAIKQGGTPLYKRARKAEAKGEVIDKLPLRHMDVMEAELLALSCTDTRCIARVRFFVGSGTYIRSLGEELGRRLGYPATLQNLRRTRVGEYDVKDAEVIEKSG